MFGGGILFGLLLLVLLVRHGGSGHAGATDVGERSGASAPTVTVSPQAAAPLLTPQSIVPQTFDLAAAIASAPPGATVKVPPGFYGGGLVLNRPVRIIGTAGQVLIQSDGRECLTVGARGVFVQGVQFICNGIGELPAISVADAAELELDGCRVQSTTGVGVAITGSSGLKTTGTTFTAPSGVALRAGHGTAKLTQSTISDSKIGLSAAAGGKIELQSCAFERDGASDPLGAIMVVNGEGAMVTANDCHFTGNTGSILVQDNAAFDASASTFKHNSDARAASSWLGLIALQQNSRATLTGSVFESNAVGVAVMTRSTLEMEQCAFSRNGSQTRQLYLQAMPISVSGAGSTVNVRSSKIFDSAQFAVAALNAATLTLDDVEISGARITGIAIGDSASPAAQAEIRRCKLHDNKTALGVYAGSKVTVEESEFRDNAEAIELAERESQLEMRKVSVTGNRDSGLSVSGESKARVVGSEFRGNGRGVESGGARRSNGRGFVTLEDCTIGGNKTFGVGVHAQSELTLTRVTFKGGDKTNIYKERAAIVQTDAAATPPASPDASAQPEASAPPEEGKVTPSATPSRKGKANSRQRSQRRPEDDAARILRHLFGPH